MNKKGVEMTLSLVVTIIILLVVASVIIFIFWSQMDSQNNFLKNMVNKVDKSANSNTVEERNEGLGDLLGKEWQSNIFLPLFLQSTSQLFRKKRYYV